MKARFSKTELKELGISILVMSFAIAFANDIVTTLIMFVPSLIIIAPAFALHEIGHKFAAQRYGYRAEYRMWKGGLILALAMAVITTWMGNKFMFIAPGAVYFGGLGFHKNSLRDEGKIGFAGPLVNIGLVAIFGMVQLLSTNPLVTALAGTGVYVNGFLAMFNLIPFGPLDGRKILQWNRMYWGIALSIAIVAVFFSEYLI